MRPETRPAPNTLAVSVLCLTIALGAAACTSQHAQAPARKRTTIKAADFADPSVERTPQRPLPPVMVSLEQASGGEGATTVSITNDPPPPSPAQASGAEDEEEKRIVVDQMVGQINGNPIYADEFFGDMHVRLEAEARRLPLQQWLNMVKEDVGRKLWDQMRDELLLSEFQSTLTPEQRVGVLAFIEDLQKNIQRSYGGSSEVANERLQQEEGVTLQQKVQSEAERQFILAQLRTTIASRVQVSFKDIQLYYNRNIDRFRPPPVAVFRIIRVPLSRNDRIDQVSTRLDAGDDPAKIAADLSNWARTEQNQHHVIIEERVYATTTFWGPAELNEPTQSLEVGQVTEQVDIARHAWWIYLEEMQDAEGKTLYEAQIEIERTIHSQRLRAEEQKYFQALLGKSNVTSFDTMVGRLITYAAERYYVQRIVDPQEIPVGEG